MMPPDDERALRAALRELRAADEHTAPAFADVMHRPPTRAYAWRPAALAIAAAVIFVAGISTAYRASRQHRLVVPEEVLALSAWRPITDVLLETPNSTLLREMPRLGDSVLP